MILTQPCNTIFKCIYHIFEMLDCVKNIYFYIVYDKWYDVVKPQDLDTFHAYLPNYSPTVKV